MQAKVCYQPGRVMAQVSAEHLQAADKFYREQGLAAPFRESGDYGTGRIFLDSLQVPKGTEQEVAETLAAKSDTFDWAYQPHDVCPQPVTASDLTHINFGLIGQWDDEIAMSGIVANGSMPVVRIDNDGVFTIHEIGVESPRPMTAEEVQVFAGACRTYLQEHEETPTRRGVVEQVIAFAKAQA
jgi:hypothetical protein